MEYKESLEKGIKEVEKYILEDYKVDFKKFLRIVFDHCFSLFNLEIKRKKSNLIPKRNSIRYIYENYKNELIGVEIGVQKGVNAQDILKKLNIKNIYLIDPWKETGKDVNQKFMDLAYKSTLKRLEKYKGKFEIIKDFSYNCVDKIPNNLDFVYIDGSHFYEDVKVDIENYWNKIRNGGILCGHDFSSCEHNQGVTKAVTEFAHNNNLKLYVESPDWWIKK